MPRPLQPRVLELGSLLCVMVIAALAVAVPAEAARKRTPTRPFDVRVDALKPGTVVPKSFLGFSIEYPDLPAYTGGPGAPNELFVRLLQTLAAYGNGPPSLRIGGNSGDQSWWNPAGAPRPPNVFTDITPQWVEALTVPVTRLATPVILGLNLALNDPGNARAFAEAVASRLPPGSIESLEIGNEPDLYPHPKTFHVGRRVRHRPQHRPIYGPDQYFQELDAYLAALSGQRLPLAAGGFASAAWDQFSTALLDRSAARSAAAGRVAILSGHAYPLRTCGTIRRRPRRGLIGRLLANSRAVARVKSLVAIARSRGVPLRLSEANSTVCGGVKGVSDTFATALWATNALFGYLDAGVRGVNIHTWHGAFYAPFEFRRRGSSTVALVRPLFYGILLFARATAQRAQLLPTGPRRRHGVRIWATRNIGGTVRVVAVNTSKRVRRRVRVQLVGVVGPGSLERLTAPGLRAKHRTTLAGKSYGRATPDVLLRGRHREGTVRPDRGRYKFWLPAASAAMLTVRPIAPRPLPQL
jgi:hypothetical protein